MSAQRPTLIEVLHVLGMTKTEFEELAFEICQNMPLPSGYAFHCPGWDYEKMIFDLVDNETGKKYTLNRPKILGALAAYVVMKIQGELPGIIIDGPFSDPCSYDSESLDAIIQLAVFGEVIYG
jgi:hypothetical protein